MTNEDLRGIGIITPTKTTPVMHILTDHALILTVMAVMKVVVIIMTILPHHTSKMHTPISIIQLIPAVTHILMIIHVVRKVIHKILTISHLINMSIHLIIPIITHHIHLSIHLILTIIIRKNLTLEKIRIKRTINHRDLNMAEIRKPVPVLEQEKIQVVKMSNDTFSD